MAKRPIKLSDQIRHAVVHCGETRYAIAQATEIDQATLSRFMSRERGLPMKTLDRLAEHLGLIVIVKRQRQRKG
jgi:hypothetical protein